MDFLRISSLANKRVADLSGGEQQRVAIARAIITEPEVLLMDEPFSQVDSLLKNQLRDDVRRLSRELGITIILVSHDPQDGLSLADEMLILRKGEMIEKDIPVNLYNQPQHLYTAMILANCNLLSAEAGRLIGLKTKKDTIAIYPEWLNLHKSWSSKKFTVVESFYKGFYEELLLERKGIRLRAINSIPGKYRQGDKVAVEINKFLEYAN